MDGIHFRYDPNNYKSTPPYKIVLELKPSTYSGNGYYIFWFRNERKTVQNHLVSFYAKSMLDALQAFNADEVKKMTIEFD
jgi:hypothetical protein